jgi:hypothetical protein
MDSERAGRLPLGVGYKRGEVGLKATKNANPNSQMGRVGSVGSIFVLSHVTLSEHGRFKIIL